MTTALDDVRDVLEGNVYRERLWDDAYLVESVKSLSFGGSNDLVLQVYDLTKDVERAYADFSAVTLSRMHKISPRDLTAVESENLAYREAELDGIDAGVRSNRLSVTEVEKS